MVYQPIVDLATGAVVGAEALSRWTHPGRGEVPPDVFIPLAEESDLITALGTNVLTEACRQAGRWRDGSGQELPVWVNLSPRQLEAPGFVSQVLTQLAVHDLSPRTLVCEVTEGLFLDPAGIAAQTLHRLRLEGIRIAIDDFGTGYSSLACLQQLPVDILKLDRQFVTTLTRDRERSARSHPSDHPARQLAAPHAGRRRRRDRRATRPAGPRGVPARAGLRVAPSRAGRGDHRAHPTTRGGGTPMNDPSIPGFSELLDARDFGTAFQPVLDLRNSQTVGFEALARGPEGSAWSSPAQLLATAREHDRLAELDWVCRTAAFQTLLDAELPAAISLFVNIEPESLSTPCPPDLAEVLSHAESTLRVFVEVNDRALAADPAALLAAVDRARTMRWGVSVDDVGASRGCLAVLPLVQADVVKLDLQLLARSSEDDAAAVITAVLRHVEASGASLIAEGIQTEDDARLARALGASHGQGHLFGHPAALPADTPVPRVAIPLIGHAFPEAEAIWPGEVIATGDAQRIGEAEYARLAGLLIRQAGAAPGRPLVMASSSPSDRGRSQRLERLAGLGGDALLLVLFGPDAPPEAASAIRGVRLEPTDPLTHDEFLVVLTEVSATALLAHRPATAPGELDVVLTQNEATVHALARNLARRIPPPGPDNHALPEPVEARREPDDENSHRRTRSAMWLPRRPRRP